MNEIKRIKIHNNKKGSSAVFLTVILASLMTIAITLIYGVKAETTRSSVDAVVNLAGDSVLSEFNRDLYEDYGLFLINGTDEELSSRLHDYISFSFDDVEDVKIRSVKVSAGRFSTADPTIIKEQIIDHMKVMEAEGLIKTAAGKKDDNTDNGSEEGRVLRHGPTITSLPSASIPKRSLTAAAEAIADKADEVEGAFESGTDAYLINRYILSHFNNKEHTADTDHFFRNEAEYILGGELSDRKNEKRVEMALKAMRFPINMAYLHSDPEKQAALAAAAQVLTPGAAAAATQAALASTWAYAEADNDVELLWQGYKIPMVKDSSTWAIELDTAIEGVFGGTVKPAVEKGYDYEGYLQILLFFQDENIKLARIMDLIQINMRAEHDGDFLIGEYAAGITVEVDVNGKVYIHEKKY